MSENQTDKPNITLNLPRILDLGCGAVQQLFFRQKEDRARQAFKSLKHGEVLDIGALTLTSGEGPQSKKSRIPVSLELVYTEFRGPGFGFPVFRVALQGMLERIATTMRARRDLNILTNKATGGVLIHQPGIIRMGEQINVLALALEPGKKGIVFRLMFVNPDQYRRKSEDAVQEVESDNAG